MRQKLTIYVSIKKHIVDFSVRQLSNQDSRHNIWPLNESSGASMKESEFY